MYCNKCGQEIKPNEQYCGYCGQEVHSNSFPYKVIIAIVAVLAVFFTVLVIRGNKDSGTTPQVTETAAEPETATAPPVETESFSVPSADKEKESMVSDDVLKLIEQAEAGDTLSQVELAVRYYTGDGVELNYDAAAQWYKRAAELGDSAGLDGLGRCYYDGNGVEQDYAEALNLWWQAADMGNSCAMADIGICYFYGTGVASDYLMATSWFEKAADLDQSKGQTWLGCCYYNGYGVKQDYEKAYALFTKAAEQGADDGRCWLGLCYEHGLGTAQDYNKAAEFYRMAAEANYSDGQYLLARCYYTGRGVAPDKDLGLEWLRKAMGNGHSDASEAYEVISKIRSGSNADSEAMLGAYYLTLLSGMQPLDEDAQNEYQRQTINLDGFTLIDINKDGVKELIVGEFCEKNNLWSPKTDFGLGPELEYVNVYAYGNNGLMLLGSTFCGPRGYGNLEGIYDLFLINDKYLLTYSCGTSGYYYCKYGYWDGKADTLEWTEYESYITGDDLHIEYHKNGKDISEDEFYKYWDWDGSYVEDIFTETAERMFYHENTDENRKSEFLK